MLLVDSLYINDSGGKILLEYLVEKLEKEQIAVFYLFDERCSKDFCSIPENRKLFLKATIWNRFKFYRNYGKGFEKIFCFGNLPPITYQKAKVITYFHSTLFLDIPEGLKLSLKFQFRLKKFFLLLIKKNSDLWLVQSEIIKKKLVKKYSLKNEIVLQAPFYPPITVDRQYYERNRLGFIYVSNGSPYKNHKKLIEAFCCFFDESGEGSLILTIPDRDIDIIKIIEDKQKKGYPIKNIGFVKRSGLYKFYRENEFLIFPSLTESFGLGIVEGIESGCKIIAADLPYVRMVCKPSLVFNPYNVKSIQKAFQNAANFSLPETRQHIFNEIDKILFYLKTQ